MATIEATRKSVENFSNTNSIESDLVRIWNKKNLDLLGKLNIFMAPDQQKLSLFQKVILMINSLPEVTRKFSGMRS